METLVGWQSSGLTGAIGSFRPIQTVNGDDVKDRFWSEAALLLMLDEGPLSQHCVSIADIRQPAKFKASTVRK